MQTFNLPTGHQPGSRPLPENWANMVSFLRRRVPFLTEALSVLPILVNDDLPRPVQTDGKALQVNPDLYDRMCEIAHPEGQDSDTPWFPTDQAGMAYMILRSCLQLVLRYDQRRGTRRRKVWAESVDNVTNQMLVDIFKLEPFGYTQGSEKHKQLVKYLKSTGRYDPRFFGKTADEIYDILVDERPDEDEPPPSDGSGPEGDGKPNDQKGEGNSKKPPKKDSDTEDDKDQDGQGKGDGQDDQDQNQDQQQPSGGKPPQNKPDQDQQDQNGDGDQDGDQGKGAQPQDQTGGNQPLTPQTMMGDDFGDNVPNSGINDDLGQLVDNACADYLERHGQLLAGTGSVASREVRLAKEKPKISLRQVVKKLRDVLPQWVWSYRKPSRSDLAFFLKTGKRTRMPSASPDPGDLLRELIIVIDFSASMGEKEIKHALNVFREAFKYTGKGRKVRVIGFTTHVVFDEEFTEHTVDRVKVGFSGGTYIYSAMEHIDRMKYRPSAIILLTDAECSSLDKIRVWHYLPRLRTILVNHSAWGKANMPGTVFEIDQVLD